ncbi:MAG: alpha/beta hydrolase [Paracoccaceae bacterium]
MTTDIFDGHPTAWRIWDKGGARPVLALHCSLAHGGAWAGLVERLSGITVTAPDQPGHGNSADWDGVTELQGLSARIAIAMIERAGGGPVDLFGHSFGGTVALRLALDRPDLVRSLMLVEPVLFAAAHAAGAPEWADYQAANAGFEALLAEGRRDEAAAAFHAQWGNGQTLASLPERQRRYILDRIHLIAAQAPALVQDAGNLLAAGRMEALQVPVLLAEGERSPPVVGAIQSELARRLPMARRVSIAGAGHMLPISHGAALASEVQAHLDAVCSAVA